MQNVRNYSPIILLVAVLLIFLLVAIFYHYFLKLWSQNKQYQDKTLTAEFLDSDSPSLYKNDSKYPEKIKRWVSVIDLSIQLFFSFILGG
jgi:predicted membrane metal-binding protein